MLPLYGSSIVLHTFVDIIKYILKSFINGGRRKENVWFIFSTRVPRVRVISFHQINKWIWGWDFIWEMLFE